MKPLFNYLGLIMLTLSVSACSSLVDLGSEQAPERVYLLKPYLVDQGGSNPPHTKISVAVSAAPGLDSNKILILEPDAHLNHYASARWPDYSTEVFASLIRNSLASTQYYSKATEQASSSADKLSLEIKELYTLNDAFNNAQTVRVLLQGYLECNGASTTINLSSDIAVSQNKLSVIVAAYQSAVNEISEQLLNQVQVCQ